ncbi:MAG: CinA family protein [Ruminococcus sp.]|nr:CinA family protein [Ruminococcus sp.]
MEEIVKYLIDNKITIATMESCTGGLLASLITDIPGASDILKFSAVTYSSEYKIKMGVNSETIDKYTVYSEEVANEMAYNIANFSNSFLGVGITGRLTSNINEPKGVDITIYDKRTDKYYHSFVKIIKDNRRDNKLEVIEEFKKLFNSTFIL